MITQDIVTEQKYIRKLESPSDRYTFSHFITTFHYVLRGKGKEKNITSLKLNSKSSVFVIV